MPPSPSRVFPVTFLAVALTVPPADSAPGVREVGCPFPNPTAPAALPNDNRTPAGILRSGVLELKLEIRLAGWYPDGPAGCGLPVHVFAEAGKPATTPGPLIRVRVGTDIRAAVRNDLTTAIRIAGFQDHGQGSPDTTRIAPGGTHEFTFRVTVPGTYFYRAMPDPLPGPGAPDPNRQLVGAFIVDPEGPVPEDRVFVITRWRKFVLNPAATTPGEPGFPAGQRVIGTINGLSWPYTERLSARQGDTLRWRIVNADLAVHPLHLHGFYFRVAALGNMALDTVYDAARPRMAVTAPTLPWSTMTIEWTPDRPGNWLFHCHMVAHMSPRQRVDRILAEGLRGGSAESAEPASVPAMHTAHAHEMAGLILGLTVQPSGTSREIAAAPEPERRRLRLFLHRKPKVFGEAPGYGFVLQQGAREPRADSIRIPGSELNLTRGEPVEITVRNRAPLPLSVHWHGIELESYFDGVGGWSGDTRRIAPPIAANDSFVVRFTPPRAGTFIYHVHDESGSELASGLYGALIVREPGDDGANDRIFVMADAGPSAGGVTFINGSTSPDTIDLVAGRTYRMRLVSILSNGGRIITLAQSGGEPHPWRFVARDGWEESGKAPSRTQQVRLGPGMTADYELTPAAAGMLTLTAEIPNRPLRTVVPIRVREPGLGNR